MAVINKEYSRFDARLPKEQKEFFERAANLGGYRSLTDFIMLTVQEKAKEIIKTSLATLSEVHSTRPNAYMTRTFFDAKSDEIVSIFSGGPAVPSADLVEMLNRMSPTNSSKWTKIR